MEIQACYKIGYIAKSHGLKGEVTAILTEDLDETIDTIFLGINNSLVPYFIKRVSGTNTKAIIAFEDVITSDKAASLKGCSLYLPKSLRPKLKRGNFYDDELTGFSVEDKNLGALGRVVAIIESGSNTLYSVMNDNKEILIPANAPFILSIRKVEKKITVELPEGFLDL